MFLSEYSLGELAAPVKSAFATGPFGSAVSSKNFRAAGIPMLRGGNLSGDVGTKLDESDLVFLSDELASEFGRSTAHRGDLVFTCWGTVGQIGLIDQRSRYESYVVSNKQMKMTPDPLRVDSLFLYLYLSQRSMVDLVQSQAIGSSVPGFNLGQLRSLRVAIPFLPEQRAIAEVLGALDNKIAANMKLSATADAWVRTSFSELAAGSQQTRPLSELARYVRDLVDPALLEGQGFYVGLEHIPRRSMWLDSSGFTSSVTSSKSRFERGDVLFGKLRPYFHKVVAAPCDGVCSTDILVLRSVDEALSGYLLAAAASDPVIEHCTAASEGTRMPRTSWRDLAAAELPWPGSAPALEFSHRVATMRNAIDAKLRENQRLADLRDVLLPQLMSGKIRVKDAEDRVGEVL